MECTVLLLYVFLSSSTPGIAGRRELAGFSAFPSSVIKAFINLAILAVFSDDIARKMLIEY